MCMTRSIIIGAVGLILGAMACTVQPHHEAIARVGQAVDIGQDEVVGSLRYGQTSAPVAYTASKGTYRAFTITGNENDELTLTITTTGTKADAWFEPSALGPAIAVAAGAPAVLHVKLPYDSTYYVAFRDDALADATFMVKVEGVAGAPPALFTPPPGVSDAVPFLLTCQEGRKATCTDASGGSHEETTLKALSGVAVVRFDTNAVGSDRSTRVSIADAEEQADPVDDQLFRELLWFSGGFMGSIMQSATEFTVDGAPEGGKLDVKVVEDHVELTSDTNSSGITNGTCMGGAFVTGSASLHCTGRNH
jgi:hypothetical protein